MEWAIIFGAIGAVVGIWSIIRNEYNVGQMRSNCIATLNKAVEVMQKDIDRHRTEINDIYGKISTIQSDLAFLKGRMNGNVK